MFMNKAIIDRDNAWNDILKVNSFGTGGSRANALYWAASRPAPPINYTADLKPPQFSAVVKTSCAANSPCNVLGMYQLAISDVRFVVVNVFMG